MAREKGKKGREGGKGVDREKYRISGRLIPARRGLINDRFPTNWKDL